MPVYSSTVSDFRVLPPEDLKPYEYNPHESDMHCPVCSKLVAPRHCKFIKCKNCKTVIYTAGNFLLWGSDEEEVRTTARCRHIASEEAHMNTKQL